jgi:hypothetical protein
VKKLWPYFRSFLIIIPGIIVIATGMHWGVKTWGMKNIHVDIDWVEFIKFNDRMYLLNYNSYPIAEENLIPYDTIRFKLSGNVNDPNYRSKNGDASFLDVGTPVYYINGYSPLFRLWAGGSMFEVDTNPKARKGADLLDIGGKVEYIDTDSPSAVTIREPDRVAALVDMVLNSPVNQQVQPEGRQVFIYFHMKDGTMVCRSFWPDQSQLSRGIMLPEEFWKTLEPGEKGEN